MRFLKEENAEPVKKGVSNTVNEKEQRTSGLHPDVYYGLVFVALAIFAAMEAFSFPIAARRLPIISCILLTFLSAILIIRGILKGNRQKQEGQEIKKLLPWKTAKYALITFGMTGLYILIMDKINFYIATVLFVPGMMLFMRVRNKWVIIGCTVGITLFCWYMFDFQLNIRMP